MSIIRCDRHGSWDSDVTEQCELCAINEQELAELREASNVIAQRIGTLEQCHYCKQWYPRPVSYHHSESDCQQPAASPPMTTARV